MSKVCTHDNPNTMQRECWQDGKLLCSYSAELLESKRFLEDEEVHRKYLFWGANIGNWKTGQFWGDLEAMKVKE